MLSPPQNRLPPRGSGPTRPHNLHLQGAKIALTKFKKGKDRAKTFTVFILQHCYFTYHWCYKTPIEANAKSPSIRRNKRSFHLFEILRKNKCMQSQRNCKWTKNMKVRSTFISNKNIFHLSFHNYQIPGPEFVRQGQTRGSDSGQFSSVQKA